METINKTVWDVIKKFEESTQLRGRIVGSAPTIEWTGFADLQLLGELDCVDIEYAQFISNVRGQSLFGKKCIKFVIFGRPPE